LIRLRLAWGPTVMDDNTRGVVIALIIVTLVFAIGYWGNFMR
jgi:hypothetical protein